jgi:hypothetical protein
MPVVRTDGITPERIVQVWWDGPEWVLQRPATGVQRSANQIVPDTGTTGIYQLPSGGLQMEPVQFARSQGDPALAAASIRLAEFNHIPSMAEMDLVAETAKVGAIYDTARTAFLTRYGISGLMAEAASYQALLNVGLPYQLMKAYAAGATQNEELTADAAAFPKPIGGGTLQQGAAADRPDPDEVDSGTYYYATDTDELSLSDGATWEEESVYPFPLDRILCGTVTYPPNCGFALRFVIPGNALAAYDAIGTFYFGGPADCLPDKKHGGEFACTLYGNGTAVLWERLAGEPDPDAPDEEPEPEWKEVLVFRWAEPSAVTADKGHQISFIPHGWNCMDILSSSTDASQGPASAGRIRFWRRPGKPNANTFRGVPPIVDYTAKRSMTGPGVVRMDWRRDLNPVFDIQVLTLPTQATLVDRAFSFRFPLEKGTTVYCSVIAAVPQVCSFNLSIIDARTEVPLVDAASPGGRTWAFTTPTDPPPPADPADAVTDARVEITFNGDGKQTPVIYGIDVWAEATGAYLDRVPITGGRLKDLSITGPDLDVSHETAHIELEDLTDALQVTDGGVTAPLLRTRGRVLCKVCTYWQDTVGGAWQESVLFEGETTDAPSEKTGKPARTGSHGRGTVRLYPSVNAHDYSATLAGRWARLKPQGMSWCLRDFSQADPTRDPAPFDDYGKPLPWRIQDMIRWLFNAMGVPDEELDIPDVQVRAYLSGTDAQEFMLTPAADIPEVIFRLAKDYLGCYVIRDPNACIVHRTWGGMEHPTGMWRVLQPPALDATPIWNFTTGGPGVVSGGLVKVLHRPEAYPARTSFIRKIRVRADPPEVNLVNVTATGDMLQNGQGEQTLTKTLWNPRSVKFTDAQPEPVRSHPDYLGFLSPLERFDTLLFSEEMLNFVCKRIFNRSAYGLSWRDFAAPLVLVDDSSDIYLAQKRPLRVYDYVTINGYPAIFRNANAKMANSYTQWGFYQALMVTDHVYQP